MTATASDSATTSDRSTPRCLYCDMVGHDKRRCIKLTEHLRAGKVRLDERHYICDPETGKEYRFNRGKGGIIKLVEEKEKQRGQNSVPETANIGEAYAIFIDSGEENLSTLRKI